MTPVAIVTGAARGIGEAIAQRLHADGYRVALTDLESGAAARVAGELGDGAHAFHHDVRELESWERLLDDVREALGEDVHVLVNNAARTEFRSFWEIVLVGELLGADRLGGRLGCEQ